MTAGKWTHLAHESWKKGLESESVDKFDTSLGAGIACEGMIENFDRPSLGQLSLSVSRH